MARRKARELAFRALFQADRGGVPLLELWQQIAQAPQDAPFDLLADDPDGAQNGAGVAQDGVRDSARDEADDAYGDRLDPESVAFAGRLVRQFADNRTAVDEMLGAALEGWSFQQMAQTDLNVLRLALTELRFEAGVPKEVTIEMAIRIAKKFGGEESGRFVNGVLARLVRQPELQGK